MKSKLLVALPCLNEEATLRETIVRINTALSAEGSWAHDTSIVVIDDGSTDNSAEVARSAGAAVVSHGCNRGVGAAFHSATDYALRHNVDLMVTVDADGQFDPDDIPALCMPVVEGRADVVTASRFIDARVTPRNIPFVKLWGNYAMALLISSLTGRRYHDVSCGFRAYSREALLHLNLYGKFTYTQETFLDLSFKDLHILEVPVQVQYFEGRKSRVAGSILRYAAKTFSIIVRAYRDYKPVRFFWMLAGLFSVAGGAVGSILLRHYLHTGRMSGEIWAGLTGASLLFIGLIFFVLGIVADMLRSGRRNQERILYYLRDRRTTNAQLHSCSDPYPQKHLGPGQGSLHPNGFPEGAQ